VRITNAFTSTCFVRIGKTCLGTGDRQLGIQDQPLGIEDCLLGTQDCLLGIEDRQLGIGKTCLGAEDQRLGMHNRHLTHFAALLLKNNKNQSKNKFFWGKKGCFGDFYFITA
jgi:hypothetical protein